MKSEELYVYSEKAGTNAAVRSELKKKVSWYERPLVQMVLLMLFGFGMLCYFISWQSQKLEARLDEFDQRIPRIYVCDRTAVQKQFLGLGYPEELVEQKIDQALGNAKNAGILVLDVSNIDQAPDAMIYPLQDKVSQELVEAGFNESLGRKEL